MLEISVFDESHFEGRVDQRIQCSDVSRHNSFHALDIMDFNRWKIEWNVKGIETWMELNIEGGMKWNDLVEELPPDPEEMDWMSSLLGQGG